jgi:hypothetical protein
MRYGQLRYRVADPGKAVAAGRRPLVRFTRSPCSSVGSAAMLTELGRDRLVIAFANLP